MKSLRLRRIAAFLLPTFALSWGFHVLAAATIGSDAYLDLGLSPLDMFFPAAVALTLRLFVLADSPIHVRRYQGRPRWILLGLLLLTGIYGAVTLMALWTSLPSDLLRGLGSLLPTLWTLLVFFLAGQSTKEQLDRAGLQVGDTDWAVRFGLGVVVFFALQAGLNLLLGLGSFQGPVERVYGVPVPDGLYPLALTLALGLAVTGIPLSGLAAVFGEEYGWRGFLQDELMRLGRRPGALLVALIWGVWHIPVILSGAHTYPATGLGIGLGLVFFVMWGFVQSYAVLKTGSIWVAAFLHGLVNSVYGYTVQYVVRPDDKVLSFGLGVYGLACLALVVLFILRDPVWAQRHKAKGIHT
jgi:membrane protease YdiL (CAAX protease family)